MRFTDRSAAFAATIVAASAIVAPAHAQLIKKDNDYYTIGNFTLKTEVFGSQVFLGKDTAFNTLPGTITLTMAPDTSVLGNTFSEGTTIKGKSYIGLCVFGTHRLNVQSAKITRLEGYDSSTLNIERGQCFDVDLRQKSTLNLNGASAEGNSTTYIKIAKLEDSSTVNVIKGYIEYITLSGKSKINITDVVLDGLLLKSSTATANFVGEGYSFKYIGYSRNEKYRDYVDTFRVSRKVGNGVRTHDVHILNAAGAGGTENAKPRQFTFNGVSPVPVRPGTIRRNR